MHSGDQDFLYSFLSASNGRQYLSSDRKKSKRCLRSSYWPTHLMDGWARLLHDIRRSTGAAPTDDCPTWESTDPPPRLLRHLAAAHSVALLPPSLHLPSHKHL
ncbi:hypothetical protein E2C01_051378 [Portunus trituberculatus]|uniref:Uncharacterized protein n=1 Tax=Portunus trituberculatus TaxID=210409 RepID=A0A5B7GIR3_PORTR|nr:hypothetical protein [Portunus trituberculatus]